MLQTSPLTPGSSASSPPPAARAGDTTRDNPWPLRRLSENLKTYIDRAPELWVEGQVVEYKPRPGTKMSFFVLRDVDSDVSMTVSTFAGVLDRAGKGFEEGARIVTRVKPVFWERRGTLNLRADVVELQGEGNLLARIEQLRRQLDAEGIFAQHHKKPLPFLPRSIGVVCGRNAKAKDDVLVNASARWPGMHFEVREVAVQGEHCVREVTAAVKELDALAHVDVIIVARGGGSVEDLLPFSDEAMVRCAFAATTPLVSAIGHEGDAPLLDLVADYRASTPTDAARKTVPDWLQESEGTERARTLLRTALSTRLAREQHALDLLISRPVLTQPHVAVDAHSTAITTAIVNLRSQVMRHLEKENSALTHAQATLRALSPQSTFDRGYSLLRSPDGRIVRSSEDLSQGDIISATLAQGSLTAAVIDVFPPHSPVEASPAHRNKTFKDIS